MSIKNVSVVVISNIGGVPRLLLVKEKSGKYNIPGGKVQRGKSLRRSAFNELKEETLLAPFVVPEATLYNYLKKARYMDRKHRDGSKTRIYFLCLKTKKVTDKQFKSIQKKISSKLPGRKKHSFNETTGIEFIRVQYVLQGINNPMDFRACCRNTFKDRKFKDKLKREAKC